MDGNEVCREDVHDLLRHLSRSRDPGPTPLAELEVVRQGLAAAGVAPSEQALQFEVGRQVITLVECELERLRRQAGMCPPAAPPGQPGVSLLADFGWANRELESWSALYHLYLRPDLDMSLKHMVGLLAGRHRRTVQRRLQRGVTALTERLQESERRARHSARRDWAAARLPWPGSARLFGRRALLGLLIGLVEDPGRSTIIALRGPGGIGKTAAALAVARHCVERDWFEDLVWLSGQDRLAGAGVPGSNGTHGIAEAGPFAVRDGYAPARAAPRRRGCLVVLDGLNDPAAAEDALRLLDRTSHASRILVTGRVGWSAYPHVRVVDITPLDRRASLELLRACARRRGLPDVADASDAVLEPVIAATAGHPMAVQLAAAQLRAASAPDVAADFLTGAGSAAALYGDLWAAAWQSAAADVRAVVRAVLAARQAGWPADGSTIRRLAGLEEDALRAALAQAIDAGLLIPSGDAAERCYQTALFLRRFLRQAAAGTAAGGGGWTGLD